MSPYHELLMARYNAAVQALQAHAATDELLMRIKEPRDSEATQRLRELYSRARFEVRGYLAMLGSREDRKQLDAIARGDGYDDWCAFDGGDDSLPCDPPPSDHGAGGAPLKAW
jgi:hypothetical protein